MDDELDVAAPGDADLSPEEMLALIDGQTRGVRRAFTAQVPVYYFVWGGAWLVGYLVLWSGWEGTTSPVQLPLWIGAIVFGLLILGAAVTSAVVGVRANRGIKGVSDFVGTLYGLSWPILGTAFAAVGVAIQRAGASSDVTAIYYTSAYALLAGGMYLAGAMIWRSVDQLVIALILIVAAAVTGFFGAPANMLAMALIVGPALIVGGIVSVVRLRRL
ncbi:hypothetical protein H4J02_03195 [Protaetiibacter sp. SSC-01]|uniref:hypothetical protein n=1 Tax=Protaetiibacter sp. SSC-01 TaxID=2759943 RepID=UPI001656EF28|nr:hypothetical protein [Protaetiibacter sp. SSC-01]QNO38049.1 hypothetical protein H4J02_03195 [Protaetiibacter sp. SSC-01]